MIETNHLPDSNYLISKNKRLKIPMLRSDLCDYSVVHVVM